MSAPALFQRHSPVSPGSLRATRPLRVALLGCGNIGGALAQELSSRAPSTRAPRIQLCAVLVRDTTRARSVAPELLATTVDQVLSTHPDAVAECMGGVAIPAAACEAFLRRGIHVVSANKSMVAAALPTLLEAARGSGAQLRFDAAVCAGVPVLDAVSRLRSARICSVSGIVNGTCNFILHSMIQSGWDLESAVAEAIRLGYAEPDPTADLSGQDSAEKLCLLTAAAGLGVAPPADVQIQGLSAATDAKATWEAVDRSALHDVRTLGHAVRLIAHACTHNAGVELSVSPTIVPAGSALANATGTQNVVTVETELAGTVTLSGPGAGARPTVAALVADIAACADNHQEWTRDLGTEPYTPLSLAAPPPAHTWLLRVTEAPSQRGSPESFAAVTASHGVALQGASFLPGRALLQVHASAHGLAQLANELRRRGARMQRFRLAKDVTLRF